jgi:anthranilate phosphoribosyltransferase
MKEALAKLRHGQQLTTDEMASAVDTLISGKPTSDEIRDFLTGLHDTKETVDELVGAVRVLRSKAVALPTTLPVVDTCGTGGDGLGTFNISTAAAFVAASAGAYVAKHGNRAASGKVGAADVLEALGAAIELSPEVALRCLERCHITFLYAPKYHPAVGNIAKVRRQLPFRTIFNLTGPLCNPAGARRQVIGVFAREWMDPMVQTLKHLGSEHVLVVHGADGHDEITPAATTYVLELLRGEIRTYEIEPQQFGMKQCGTADLVGGDAAHNAKIMREVLGGLSGPYSDATALNAGAAIYVAGISATLAGGIARAREILRSGEAIRVLDAFIAETRFAA